MSQRLARARRAPSAALAAVFLAACGGVQLGSRPPGSTSSPATASGTAPRAAAPGASGATAAPTDINEFYRQAGLVAQGAPMPFAGSVSYLAAARDDSTHAVIALSLATTNLTFRREGDQFRADYRVTLTFKKGESVVDRLEATEPVRVSTIRETQRAEESVLFQQLTTLVPGTYTMTVAVRDEGSGRSASTDYQMRVPQLGNGSIATPVPFYEVQPRATRDSLPLVMVNPRAAATFGRDSSLLMYVESYGDDAVVSVSVRVENSTVWSEKVQMRAAGNGLSTGIARIPLTPVGLGAAKVIATREGSGDTTVAPMLIGFGDGLPVSSYAEMVGYLRYFASGNRLRELEAAPADKRGAVWSAFFRESDTSPSTPENEALQNYLARVLHVNETYAEGTLPGWRTDRGMVYLLLGQPDQVIEPIANDPQRARFLTWEYRSLNLTVEFFRAGQTNWRLTPNAENDVWQAAKRLTGITR